MAEAEDLENFNKINRNSTCGLGIALPPQNSRKYWLNKFEQIQIQLICTLGLEFDAMVQSVS